MEKRQEIPVSFLFSNIPQTHDTIYLILNIKRGGVFMQDRYSLFFNTAGINPGGLTKEEKGFYLQMLNEWLVEVPDIRPKEMPPVIAFIEGQIRYYLMVCAKRKRPPGSYEGCMENLIFMLEYLLHFYFWKVGKSTLLRIYEMGVEIEKLEPICYAEVADYVIRTGLLMKLQFFIDYYFSE